MKNNQLVCRLKPELVTLKTDPFKRGCRYHRQPGQIFKEEDLLPCGFCPHAYAKIYPQAFSLLYNPYLKSEKILCPNKKFRVEFLLSSTYSLPLLIRKLKKIGLFLLNKVGVASEFPDKKISIEVDCSDDRCPKSFTNGDTFTFNIWRRRELCPASFYAMYPFYFKGSVPSFHCPDPNGVSYETPKGDFSCQKVLAELKTKNDSFCPLLVYSLFPYFLTLKEGGKFEWVKPGENVKVQCPYRQGVVAEVFLQEGRNQFLQVKIVQVKGDCFLKIKKDQSFLLCQKDFDQVNFYL